MKQPGQHSLDNLKQQRRARVRLLLGTAQVAGATAGLCLLLTTGGSIWTIIIVGLTLSLTVLSRAWFPWTRRNPRG